MIPEGSHALREVYRRNRISVGGAIGFDLHRRHFEAMRDGCMVVQMEVDFPFQVSSYKHYFKNGESIVACNGKQELYNKLDFYLSNDIERTMVANGAHKVLQENKLNGEDVLKKIGRRLEDIIREVQEC